MMLAACCLVAATAVAQPKTKLRPDRTLLLYPQGQNVDQGIVENGKAITLGPGESNEITLEEEIPENGNISNITQPTIDLYFPKKPNGQLVVVVPGGGYRIVSSYNEGVYVADWMLSQGITVCVVKYRLPNGHWTVPLTDVQNAFRYCRAHAEEWKVKQIGIIGFSAGGHLAASASNLYVDAVTRPDFSILIYPVIQFQSAITHRGTQNNLIGKQELWDDKNLTVKEYEEKMHRYETLVERYSLEKQVTENTPVTFIAHCLDDKTVPIQNSFCYMLSLKEHKVPAEMHVYPTGGHGWGFTTDKFGKDKIGYCREDFFNELSHWLKRVSVNP